MRKHFAVVLSDPPPSDFQLIERTFLAINRTLSLAALIPEQIFIKSPFTMTNDEMAKTKSLALSFMNGVAARGETATLHSRDGATATVPADAVILLPLYFFTTDDLQIGTLIHELGHFVGRPESDPDGIDDPPNRSSGDASLAQLPAERRPRIAEIYAQFAFEAHFGRPMIRALLKF